MSSTVTKYGFTGDALELELEMIRKGEVWLKTQGRSLFLHYKEAMKLLWPRDDHHRWSDLILKAYCENDITVLVGCSDSSKTFTMSKIILVDYWAFPDDTLWLVSTTEGRGSELRIWGVIKDLFNLARQFYDWHGGNPIDYLKTITTEELDEDRREARRLRRGIIVVPCKSGGLSSGLSSYIGIKAPRLRHAGDEVAVMSDSFLNAYSNWYGKEDFKGIMSGNFMEMDDPLGIASEPEGGWEAFVDTGKTQTWRSKFYHAFVVALDGRDSPNFDFPQVPGARTRYPYLIGQKKLDGVATTNGTDSWQWYSQCVGKPVKGMDIWRVLTKDFCVQHRATEEVVWLGPGNLHLYSLDPAYAGGDRCIGRHWELGMDVNKMQILFAHSPEVIPIKVNINRDAEAQIAQHVFQRAQVLGIKAENIFYDSFGRGTLGFEFARIFGSNCPVPVDSSARPTTRPVRFDLFVQQPDGSKRLKRCDEHYIKFVSEMYFSAREAIDSEQIRGMDLESIREGASRKFTKKDNKIEIETKDDYKERNRGRSPDMMDNFVIGVEGARQRGFKILRVGGETQKKKEGPDWLEKQTEDYKKLMEKRQLTVA